MKPRITLTGQFSAAHYYKNSQWSAKQNLEAFGNCYTEFGHGHNYTVQVSLETEDSLTSTLITHFQSEVARVCRLLDHKHLNKDIPDFAEKNPTTENLCLYFHSQLNLTGLKRIQVAEMPQIWSELNL